MKLKKIKKQNKKAVSPMIAYILLVVGAIAMGGLVYQWMKSYVPADEVKCDDGVSVLIESANCVGSLQAGYSLELEIKNNGRFSIAGVYVKATKDTEAKIATVDLTDNENGIYFYGTSGGVPPATKTNSFPTTDLENILSINFPPLMIPTDEKKGIPNPTYGFYVEYKVVNNKNTEAFCGSAQVRSLVVCEDSSTAS